MLYDIVDLSFLFKLYTHCSAHLDNSFDMGRQVTKEQMFYLLSVITEHTLLSWFCVQISVSIHISLYSRSNIISANNGFPSDT